MSTTYMTVYDLLRITYTYEARALEQGRSESPTHPQTFRPRADSSMSICEDPETCQHLPFASTAHDLSTSGNAFAALETDFTAQYARRGSRGAADSKRDDM